MRKSSIRNNSTFMRKNSPPIKVKKSEVEINENGDEAVVRRECLIYPDDVYKVYWDVLLAVILVLTCILTPY